MVCWSCRRNKHGFKDGSIDSKIDDDIWEQSHLEDLLNFALSKKEFVSSSYKTIVDGTGR